MRQAQTFVGHVVILRLEIVDQLDDLRREENAHEGWTGACEEACSLGRVRNRRKLHSAQAGHVSMADDHKKPARQERQVKAAKHHQADAQAKQANLECFGFLQIGTVALEVSVEQAEEDRNKTEEVTTERQWSERCCRPRVWCCDCRWGFAPVDRVAAVSNGQ